MVMRRWLLKICLVLPCFRVSHGLSARHLEVLQLAQSRASTHSRASSRALAGFQKYTAELVDAYVRTGEDVCNDTKGVINLIKQYIMEEHEDNLLGHELDSAVLDCSAKVLACTDMWFPDTTLQHIENLTIIMNDTNATHFECRVEQAECCNDPACVDYNTYRMLNKDAYTFPGCYDPDLTPDYIRTDDETDRGKMEACLHEVYEWHAPLYEKYLKCKNSVECCNEDDACDENQRRFEFAYCVGQDFINDHCQGHRTCWDKESADCNLETCAPIQSRVDIRKSENETGMRIICLLDVLVQENESGKAENLTKCKETNYTAILTFWDIDCPGAGFPPEWPVEDLEDYCATPPAQQEAKAVPSLIDHTFYFNHYYDNLLPIGKWFGVPNSFHDTGAEAFEVLEECPGHYTENVTKRNTSFTIEAHTQKFLDDHGHEASDSEQ
jgi:hypothetical protein